MKVLYVINHLPCPPLGGAYLRTLNLGLQIKKYHQMTTVCINTPNHYQASRMEQTSAVLGQTHFYPLPVYTMGSSISTFKHKFDQHWPCYLSRKISRHDLAEFDQLCQNHDFIWYEKIDTASSVGMKYAEKSIIDFDDLNHIRLKKEFDTNGSLRKKVAERLIYYKYYLAEQEAMRRFGKIGVCSEPDREYIVGLNREYAGKIHIIANGFELNALTDFATRKISEKPVLGFVGYLNYKPNFEGLCWFINDIWPIIHRSHPEVQLHIAGTLASQFKLPDKPGVKLLGFVDDLATEMSTWTALVVPLLSGGGTRLKILEGFARACPVISTRIGAYGIDARDRQNILLADDESEFINCCNTIINNQPLQKQLAENANETFKALYTWDKVGESVNRAICQ